MSSFPRPWFLVLILMSQSVVLLPAIDWPKDRGEENPYTLRLEIETSGGQGGFSGLIEGSQVVRIEEGLPLALGVAKVYDYQRLFYGVGYEAEEQAILHNLYDGQRRVRVSHYSVLPQRGDLQEPRIFDVRVLLPESEFSLVTWRNNLVPSGSLSIRIVLGDSLEGGISSGVRILSVSVSGESQFDVVPGVLSETNDRLRAQGSGPGLIVDQLFPTNGRENRLTVQGTINVPVGRSILRLVIEDFEGNENTLSFVLLGSEELVQ